MHLGYKNKTPKYRKSFIDKSRFNHYNSKLESIPINTSIKLDSRSIIFDTTYNLFFKKRNNYICHKIKIKKNETPLLNKEKYRSKTTNLRTYTKFNKNRNIINKKK